MTSRSSNSRKLLLTTLLISLAMVLLSQCEESTAPVPPGDMDAIGGQNQYWKVGNRLPEPFEVRVLTSDNSVPQDAVVRFFVREGGGSMSATRVAVDEAGRAASWLTLGPDPAVNIVEATIEDDASIKVEFRAIGSYFFCPEMSDTLQVSYGTAGNLFHVTKASSFFGGDYGVVELTPVPPTADQRMHIPNSGGIIVPVVRDGAFSPRGDYYISRLQFFEELIKVKPDGTQEFVATLELMSEIDENPIGLIAGCDAKGPFVVQCPDTLIRFTGATHGGVFNVSDANDDAMAVDPRRHSIDAFGEDLYYIYKPDSTLRRVPLDSLTLTGPVETVAQLARDEAQFCTGMDIDNSGNIYLVVSGRNTKKLLRFAPNGQRTELFDFFTVAAGDDAGMLSDIVVSGIIVYTIDTYNDNLIAFNVNTSEYIPIFSDSLAQSRISDRAFDGTKTGGERTGLALMK